MLLNYSYFLFSHNFSVFINQGTVRTQFLHCDAYFVEVGVVWTFLFTSLQQNYSTLYHVAFFPHLFASVYEHHIQAALTQLIGDHQTLQREANEDNLSRKKHTFV